MFELHQQKVMLNLKTNKIDFKWTIGNWKIERKQQQKQKLIKHAWCVYVSENVTFCRNEALKSWNIANCIWLCLCLSKKKQHKIEHVENCKQKCKVGALYIYILKETDKKKHYIYNKHYTTKCKFENTQVVKR